jgi:methionyl-tRNA formyltransferase
VEIACAVGSVYALRLLPEGKGRMSAADFIRGRRVTVGDIWS